jgi:uncharacterized tellurite resistance protein B-like protein
MKVQELSPEAQAWMGKAMVFLILSDGEVSPKEIEAFSNQVKEWMPADQLNELVSLLKNRTQPTLLKIELPKEEAFAIIQFLAKISVSDKALDRSEDLLLHKLCHMLGLPETVADLLLERLEQNLTSALNVQLTSKKITASVTGLAWTPETCILVTDFALEPEEKIKIEVIFSTEDSGQGELGFTTFQATVDRVKNSQASKDKFIIHVRFDTKLRVHHGVLHHLFPQNFQEGNPEFIETPFVKELKAVHGHCKVCGEGKVMYWGRNPSKQSYNLFGLPALLGGKASIDHLPYSAYLATVCPACLFGSVSEDFVYVAGNEVMPFQLPKNFQSSWLKSVKERKVAGNLSSGERWSVVERSFDQGVTALKIALSTGAFLIDEDWPLASAFRLKSAFAYIYLAEALLVQGKPSIAADYLREAYQLLVDASGKLESLQSLQAVVIRVMIGLLLDDSERAGRSAIELKSLELEPEHKELLAQVQAACYDAVANKSSYSIKGLPHFNPTEGLAGLSEVGETLQTQP